MARERDYDDVDDRPVGGNLGPLDKMYRDTNIVILVIFGFCCNGIAAILSLIAYLTAKDPKAKSNALVVLVIGAVITVLSWVVQFSGLLPAGPPAAGR